MTFNETLEYLYGLLPIYQQDGKAAYKPDLSNTIRLLQGLGNPHEHLKCVHIAGTNGKGTSAHGIASILQSAGYVTGLYTSPHIKQFTERIRIDGKEVDQQFVVDFVAETDDLIKEIQPSFFEVTVAMAFKYFRERKVDIAIVETGLGGRLDSTNVIRPLVSLITNIGLDHTDILGDTLQKIAKEKAGIVKKNVPLVVGEYQADVFSVFESVCDELGSQLIQARSEADWIKEDSMVPDYLKRNIPGIETVIQKLVEYGFKIEHQHISKGLNQLNELTGLKGRFQVLGKDPLTIADVSHNREGLAVLFQQMERIVKGDLYVIFGSVIDKNLNPILKILPSKAKLIWSEAKIKRSLPVTTLQNEANQLNINGSIIPDVNEALIHCQSIAQQHDCILVTGSTFLVAELNQL